MQETLFVTSSFPRFKGDYAGHFVFDMAEALAEHERVHVLAPSHIALDSRFDRQYRIRRYIAHPPFADNLFYESEAAKHLHSLKGRLKAGYALAALSAAYRQALQEILNLSKIVAHWIVPQGLVATTLTPKHVPVQTIVHGGDWRLLRKSRLGRELARFVVAQSDDVIAVSEVLRSEMLNSLGSRYATKIRHVSMGVHVERFLCNGKRDDIARRPIVFSAGRLLFEKGFHLLIDAMVGLRATLVIAGEGERMGELQAQAMRIGVDCAFLGRVAHDKMSGLLALADIVVLPSFADRNFAEGTPVFLLEAMAAGRAIVHTGSGGMSEVTKGERMAALQAAPNAASLHEAMKQLLDDAPFRKRLGENAQARALAFDWRNIVEKLALQEKEISGGRKFVF